MRDEPRTIGGALGAGIFFLPQIFGWKVLAPGYGVMTRIVVFTYMILTAIPLYFLIAAFWSSGGDIVSMAENYDKNRAATERGIDEARGYIDQYEDAELRAGRSQSRTEGSGSTSPANITARALADAMGKGSSGLTPYQGRSIVVSGRATGTAASGIYLEGNDAYPAVLIRYRAEVPAVEAGQEITATCKSVTTGTAGPELAECSS